MSLFPGYVARQFIFGDHPVLHEDQCLNQIQSTHPCRVCRDSCPQSVFDGPSPNWDLCDGCGICSGLCPTRAICMGRSADNRLLQLLHSSRPSITISCHRAKLTSDLNVSCIASLPWEYLCLLSLFHHIIICVKGCDVCNLSSHKKYVDAVMARVGSFLGKDLFQERISFTDDPSCVTGSGYTRKEVLDLYLRRSRARAGAMVPESLRTEGVSDWRQLLLHACSQLKNLSFGWAFPVFQEGCLACGICAKVCPSSAIYRVPDEWDPGQVHMAVFPSKCLECGLCGRLCPYESLGSVTVIPTKNAGKPRIHRVTLPACSSCGKPYSPTGKDDGLCSDCRGKNLKLGF